jgi:hypothetical protein
MIPSALIKPVQPSLITEDMKAHIIIPAARKGRNSVIGALNICPNTTPIVPIITPMLIVSQKGPSAERLYR